MNLSFFGGCVYHYTFFLPALNKIDNDSHYTPPNLSQVKTPVRLVCSKV